MPTRLGPVAELIAQTLGGAQALALFEPPRAEPSTPLCLVLPALGIRAAYYARFAQALSARGLRVLTADFPGHGESALRAGRGSDWGYPDLIEVHAPALVAAARARFPAAPLVWIGHSLGGQVALLRAGQAPEEAAAVVVIASGSAHYACWSGRRRASLRITPRICEALSWPLGFFPGDRVGFGGREARSLIRDWARAARSGAYRWGSFDGEAALPRWRGPTLAIPLLGDHWAPRSAMAHTLDKTGAAITWQPWSDPAPPDHNHWPREPEPPARFVAEWLTSAGLLSPS